MNMERKEFVKTLSAAALGAALAPSSALGATAGGKLKIGYLQLGRHMWKDPRPLDPNFRFVEETAPIEEDTVNRRLAKAKECGCNTIMVELAESVVYPRRPEIALASSWSAAKMNAFVRKIKSMGMNPFPALNFSGAHHSWLGKYSRMVSTPEYYAAVKDLLTDAWEIFEKPDYIHCGMDEECIHCCKNRNFCVMRTGELYWHDVRYFVDTIEKLGARPCMAADKCWWGLDEYVANCPKSVLQFNWYYDFEFDVAKLKARKRHFEDLNEPCQWRWVQTYDDLDAAGYDQVPGCSNYLSPLLKNEGATKNDLNIPRTIEYCTKHISDRRLKGFICYPWCSTTRESDPEWFDALEQFKKAYPS